MSEVTLRLPKTLHRNLEILAEKEAVSLTQYIIYILSRQVPAGWTVRVVPKNDAAEQKVLFDNLLEKWGAVSDSEAERILNQRELAEPEADLTPELVSCLQKQIAQRRN